MVNKCRLGWGYDCKVCRPHSYPVPAWADRSGNSGVWGTTEPYDGKQIYPELCPNHGVDRTGFIDGTKWSYFDVYSLTEKYYVPEKWLKDMHLTEFQLFVEEVLNVAERG